MFYTFSACKKIILTSLFFSKSKSGCTTHFKYSPLLVNEDTPFLVPLKLIADPKGGGGRGGGGGGGSSMACCC